jgi:amino acid transporter
LSDWLFTTLSLINTEERRKGYPGSLKCSFDRHFCTIVLNVQASVAEQTALRRELRLRDIVYFDICAIISLRWVAAAAHAGPQSFVLWIIAAVFFFLPSAIVIARLSQRFPEEGGLYTWTKRAFGDRHAFLCGWIYFLSTVLYFPSLLLAGITMTAYAAGASGEHLADSRMYSLAITVLVLWAAFAANFFGLRVAKWVSALGGNSTLLIGGLIVLLAIASVFRSGVTRMSLFAPELNLETLNFWSQIAFAFVGLELAPLVSGEIRNPERDLPRAAAISGGISVLFYVLVTAALLVLLRPEQISPMTGLAQASVAGAQKIGVPAIGTMFAILIGIAFIGQLDTWIAGNTRLPYVVGIDRYLPEGFKRVHPRWGTPYVSLFTQAGIATLFLLMAQLGETVRAAYQIMVDMMLIATLLPFVYIFAAGFRFASRLAAVSGIAVTVLAIALSAMPPPEAASVWVFETKVVGGSVLIIIVGLLVFRRYRRARLEAARGA